MKIKLEVPRMLSKKLNMLVEDGAIITGIVFKKNDQEGRIDEHGRVIWKVIPFPDTPIEDR